MKLITFAVPCYNSAGYMDRCIQSLLPGGEDVEIILINDGSQDETGDICDRYANEYPSIIKAIHQPNGGHGEGVNQGIRYASGLYYKVVDSDDWADVESLTQVINQLRIFSQMDNPVDLLICNYVYEHVPDDTRKPIRYTNVFPQNRIFGWEKTRKFYLSQYLLMHSVFYRTKLLRDCGLVLPKHTFYVDNMFVYQPLPFVETLYYLNTDFYRYYIGRTDQSVNENVMVKRVDQQILVTKQMMDAHDLILLLKQKPKLAKYMFNYLSMMITISSILLLIDGTPESQKKRLGLWAHLKESNRQLYFRMRYRSLSSATTLPGKSGRRLVLLVYYSARKMYRFN